MSDSQSDATDTEVSLILLNFLVYGIFEAAHRDPLKPSFPINRRERLPARDFSSLVIDGVENATEAGDLASLLDALATTTVSQRTHQVVATSVTLPSDERFILHVAQNNTVSKTVLEFIKDVWARISELAILACEKADESTMAQRRTDFLKFFI
ncbi:hypothetical protein BD410DRAFT_381045 [Rickenella mellea]|uniref:Uncharacterized protein n=1 Tax=Rickenella mellea TaxID=50990 RepID=A0A4Y7PZQ1_9AGAM|nr:hypothetical protein BD410DRAFT_381045 [Rickenella mellea]